MNKNYQFESFERNIEKITSIIKLLDFINRLTTYIKNNELIIVLIEKYVICERNIKNTKEFGINFYDFQNFKLYYND